VSCVPVGPPRCASRSSRRHPHQQVILLVLSILEVSPSPEFHHRRPPRFSDALASSVAASPEVLGSFSTSQQVESTCASLPHSLRSASRVSHPPDGLLLACLPGLVSCPCALGVPPLQSFAHDTAAFGPLDPPSAFLHFSAGACAAGLTSEFSAGPSVFDHPACAELRSCFKALFRGSCSVSPLGPSGPYGDRGSPGFRLPSRVLRLRSRSACFHRCSSLELGSPASLHEHSQGRLRERPGSPAPRSLHEREIDRVFMLDAIHPPGVLPPRRWTRRCERGSVLAHGFASGASAPRGASCGPSSDGVGGGLARVRSTAAEAAALEFCVSVDGALRGFSIGIV